MRDLAKGMKGFTVVLSLLLLILLTLLGICVARIAVIETRMSGFYKFQMDVFYVAEGGLNRIRESHQKLSTIFLSLPSKASGTTVNDPSNPYDLDPSNPGMRQADISYTYLGQWVPKRGRGESVKVRTGKQRIESREFRIQSDGNLYSAGVERSSLAQRGLQVTVEQKVPVH